MGRAAIAGVIGTALAVGGSAGQPAAAHDPGQGQVATRASVTGIVEGQRVRVEVVLDDCAGLTPTRTVARRAGQAEVGTLRAAGPLCRFDGEVETPTDGRWFVYAELEDGAGRSLETWIPVASGSMSRHGHRRDLYWVVVEPTGPGQAVAAVALLLSATALFVTAARVPVSREPGRTRRPDPLASDEDRPDLGGA